VNKYNRINKKAIQIESPFNQLTVDRRFDGFAPLTGFTRI